MAENLLPSNASLLLNAATVIATGNSANFTLPVADGYKFTMEVSGTISGTTETLDMAIQTSPDGGTTFYDTWRFTQVTTTAVTRDLVVQPIQGRGEAGSDTAVTAGGTGSVATNKPFTNPCRLRYTIAGTSPSYAVVKVWMTAVPRATAV
jgi:hypothetical protein